MDKRAIIAGGGIGGLATALTLRQIGVPCVVFEAVRDMRPLGVGVNLQPNAVCEFYDLGITRADLDRVDVMRLTAPQREAWPFVAEADQRRSPRLDHAFVRAAGARNGIPSPHPLGNGGVSRTPAGVFKVEARTTPGMHHLRMACPPAGHDARRQRRSKCGPNQEKNMSVLRQPRIKAFRGWLDLNGPLLGPVFYLFESIRSYIEERKEAFDARFGTDTAAPFLGRDQKPGAYFYVATTASLIYEILNYLALQPDAFAFVDMGSGKGRALLVASEYAFAKIVGIELSPHLHRIAKENIKRYSPASQQCTDFDLHCMDVVDYDYGPEPPVLFLFDPFGRETLTSVVANLEASLRENPREAYVVYVYPQFEDVLQASHVLRKVGEGGPPLRPWSRYVVYAASAGGGGRGLRASLPWASSS